MKKKKKRNWQTQSAYGTSIGSYKPNYITVKQKSSAFTTIYYLRHSVILLLRTTHATSSRVDWHQRSYDFWRFGQSEDVVVKSCSQLVRITSWSIVGSDEINSSIVFSISTFSNPVNTGYESPLSA